MKALRRGSEGKDVRRVQKLVGAHVDGVFGRETERAVRKWQSRYNARHLKRPISVDGVVGVITWSKMFPIRSLIRRPKAIIVLDIGHGKNNTAAGRFDGGAKGTEHAHAEKMVAALKKALEARGRVVRIVADMAVVKRDDYAARFKPYLFASNHFNGGGGRGVEVLVARRAGLWIRRLAALVCEAVARDTGLRNRGVKEDVRGLAIFGLMPQKTILIEWAFEDSKADRSELDTTVEINSAAEAVARVLDAA